jgi:hypothetical protein
MHTASKVDQRGGKTLVWTSMREEVGKYYLWFDTVFMSFEQPVIYIKGRPHVLRLLSDPLGYVVS